MDFIIHISTKKNIFNSLDNIPETYTVLVLGAQVRSSGKLSGVLEDRMYKAYILYKNNKVKKFLLSGDHGGRYYDEVNAMKKYLLDKGVPKEDIFLDHAGFDTYSSIVRAKNIFEVDDVIIVTQKFHLPRAVYIARQKKMKAIGFVADNRKYEEIKYLRFREKLANVKAIYELIVNKRPKYMGDIIPITGDSSKTFE